MYLCRPISTKTEGDLAATRCRKKQCCLPFNPSQLGISAALHLASRPLYVDHTVIILIEMSNLKSAKFKLNSFFFLPYFLSTTTALDQGQPGSVRTNSARVDCQVINQSRKKNYIYIVLLVSPIVNGTLVPKLGKLNLIKHKDCACCTIILLWLFYSLFYLPLHCALCHHLMLIPTIYVVRPFSSLHLPSTILPCMKRTKKRFSSPVKSRSSKTRPNILPNFSFLIAFL